MKMYKTNKETWENEEVVLKSSQKSLSSVIAEEALDAVKSIGANYDEVSDWNFILGMYGLAPIR